ncbi:MAG: hypothetical protein KC501_20570 [Myxococcales bacterium]|nr:hypothetical protein [Myxococcales bacterium]
MLEDVVAEHAVRAAALWDRRARVVGSRVHDLASLVELDGELRAHLTALVLAGETGWRIADETWSWQGPGDAFVSLVVAARMGDRERIEEVVSRCDRPAQLPGLISALGWLPAPIARPLIGEWSEYDGPRWRALAMAGFVAHRHDPGRFVDNGLLHPDLGVRLQAIRGVGFLDRRELVPVLGSMLDDRVSEVRFLVGRALHQLRIPQGAEALLDCAREGGTLGDRAGAIVARQRRPALLLEDIVHLHSIQKARRCAVEAAASSGVPEVMEWLLAAMDDPSTARLAGYGFTMLTGVDLEDAELEDDDRGIDSEEGHEGVEEGLPWPNSGRVRTWWDQHRRSFERAQRWRCGEPQSVRALRQILLSGPQHERGLVANDLLLMHREHAVPFEVAAPAWRQCRWLAPLRTLLESEP